MVNVAPIPTIESTEERTLWYLPSGQVSPLTSPPEPPALRGLHTKSINQCTTSDEDLHDLLALHQVEARFLIFASKSKPIITKEFVPRQ
mmetsp:Transcript_14926/g.22004  ORF Transcript_14926/g.22004 Transcript_14926/m.22004 type:complete len:89 (-) Transcript_14926:394-660(-)